MVIAKAHTINRGGIMDIKNMDTFLPKVAIRPGETIVENMEFLEMNISQLAKKLNIPDSHLIDVIENRVLINNELALKLESVFGPSAQYWLNLETNYQLTKNRLDL